MRLYARDPRYTFPVPVPASHEFFLSEIDYKDGFVHLSTAKQVPGTLNRFFADVPAVTLLRIEHERLAGFKRVRWEEAHGDCEWTASLRTGPPESGCRGRRWLCEGTELAEGRTVSLRLTAAFPHLFAHLEGENVESVKEVHRREGEKGWDAALTDKDIEQWLV